jgi:rRNA maturation endonuclease Nob1
MAVTTMQTVTAPHRIRYRCVPCEVAWTAEEDSSCWVCGEQGYSLRTAFSLREDDYLHLDFE